MTNTLRPGTYLVARRDGTVASYRLLPPGAFTRRTQTDPVQATISLNRLSPREIRIMARACRGLAALRGTPVPPALRWWTGVLGPEPEPEPSDNGRIDD